MDSKKIYIIGPVGGGKTTFATKFAKKYNIKYYELDKIVWDDDNGHIKRIDVDVQKLFNDIIETDSWVIEDIGRSIFIEGRKKADVIYYIKMSKYKAYYRVTKRIIKQKLGMERYNCSPTLNEWLYYMSIVNSYYKKEKNKIKDLQEYKDKLIYVDKKRIKEMLR